MVQDRLEYRRQFFGFKYDVGKPTTVQSIALDGVNTLQNKEAMRATLGYLPQEFGFYPTLSGESTLDHFATLKGLNNGKERKAVVEGLLAQVNLWEARKKNVGGYSGGMKQRLGIALQGVPRDSYVLSTKVGRLVLADGKVVYDFSRDGVLRSFEQSLERLKLDRIDLLLVHDPDDNEPLHERPPSSVSEANALRDRVECCLISHIARSARQVDVDPLGLAHHHDVPRTEVLPPRLREHVHEARALSIL